MAIKFLNGKNVFLKAFLMAVAIAVASFFFLSPKVTRMSFTEAENTNEAYLAIDFDKPVARQKVIHTLVPDAPGEWKFEKPLIAGHLFRRLTFIPALPLKPDTQYKLTLEYLKNSFAVGASGGFTGNFSTQGADPAQNSAPPPLPSQKKESASSIHAIPVDFHWQQRPLSCEAASLKMALSAKNLTVSEKDIMAQIGYDPTPRQGNVWGDPYEHFVGDIDGNICETGFGVYWPAVARAANTWRPAASFSNWTLDQLIKELDAGNPVVMWGVLPGKRIQDCSWYTSSGKYVKAYRQTHVRLIVGYIGQKTDPEKIILKDPLQGDLYWPTAAFLTNWKFFDNSGVVIR